MDEFDVFTFILLALAGVAISNILAVLLLILAGEKVNCKNIAIPPMITFAVFVLAVMLVQFRDQIADWVMQIDEPFGLAMALAQVATAVRCKVWGRRCRVYLDTVETVDMVSTCTVWEDQKERKQDESDCDFSG